MGGLESAVQLYEYKLYTTQLQRGNRLVSNAALRLRVLKKRLYSPLIPQTLYMYHPTIMVMYRYLRSDSADIAHQPCWPH